MAGKRMFSKDIVCNDMFYSLPWEAQLLYFHYCMQADDDGVVSNRVSISRILGINLDFEKNLIEKGLILILCDVVLITHWKINNNIRKDRYKKSLFQNELKTVKLTKENVYIPTKLHSPILSTAEEEEFYNAMLELEEGV